MNQLQMNAETLRMNADLKHLKQTGEKNRYYVGLIASTKLSRLLEVIMDLEKIFDDIHSRTIKNLWLQRFTAFTRIILAIGFVPPSLKKIMGEPFTSLPDSNPVGHYFNALYQTGFYYQFIGWGQLLAAILLLFPRTAHLGALMFLPIILNIAVLTNSVDFAGTKYITLLMLLAAIYLACWDYDRWKSLLFTKRRARVYFSRASFLILPVLFSLGGSIGFSLLGFLVAGSFNRNLLFKLPFVSLAGFVFGLICSLHHKFMRGGDLENSADMS